MGSIASVFCGRKDSFPTLQTGRLPVPNIFHPRIRRRAKWSHLFATNDAAARPRCRRNLDFLSIVLANAVLPRHRLIQMTGSFAMASRFRSRSCRANKLTCSYLFKQITRAHLSRSPSTYVSVREL